MFAFWLTYVYFNIFSNNVNKKTAKNALFLGSLSVVERVYHKKSLFLATPTKAGTQKILPAQAGINLPFKHQTV